MCSFVIDSVVVNYCVSRCCNRQRTIVVVSYRKLLKILIPGTPRYTSSGSLSNSMIVLFK